MAYNLDPTKPLPPELWAIDRQRVRAGKGPVRVVPVRPSMMTAAGVPCGIETKGGRYYAREVLYDTLAEANRVGLEMARIEHAHEAAKWRELARKLQAAFVACGGQE